MQPATNDIFEVNLSALLMLLCKLLWLRTKYFQLFCGIYTYFISWMHDTQFTILAHFALLANVTIILNHRKLLQEYHITSRYTQVQCLALNKRKWKYKKKCQSRAHGLFLYEIPFPTTFIWSFFSWDEYFRRCCVLNRMHSAVSVHCISTILFFRAA